MTVTKIIEETREAICTNYCKKPAEFAEANGLNRFDETDESMDRFYDEVCDKCPLNRL